MAEFISLTPQVLDNVGDSVAFAINKTSCNCNIRHREGSSIIRLKGSNWSCNRAKYRVSVHANVQGVAGPIIFALYEDGEQIPETVTSVVPAAATDVWSVDTDSEIFVDCDCASISFRTLTPDVSVETASIIINRVQ